MDGGEKGTQKALWLPDLTSSFARGFPFSHFKLPVKSKHKDVSFF